MLKKCLKIVNSIYEWTLKYFLIFRANQEAVEKYGIIFNHRLPRSIEQIKCNQTKPWVCIVVAINFMMRSGLFLLFETLLVKYKQTLIGQFAFKAGSLYGEEYRFNLHTALLIWSNNLLWFNLFQLNVPVCKMTFLAIDYVDESGPIQPRHMGKFAADPAINNVYSHFL